MSRLSTVLVSFLLINYTKISLGDISHLFQEATLGNANNPFQQGCLAAKLPDWKTKFRVCNSEDSEQAILDGLCRLPSEDFSYKEVRISSENWDTAYFVTWIMQIMLSELLNVPSSVETGVAEANMNFYHPDSPYVYDTLDNDFRGLQKAADLGDCTLASRDLALSSRRS